MAFFFLQSGYPFDRDSDSDGYLRSQLDDIAKRHPEIAEHLENFASRDRQRHRSTNEEAGSPRRFPRQFGDRFERFGFPFDRDDFDPEYYNQEFYHPDQDFHQPHQQHHSTNQQQQQPQPEHSYSQSPSQSPSYSQTPSYSSHQPAEPERGNLQQSSTFDLGKNQEPVDDRAQRSMSAPPSENTQNNQFQQQTENMSHANSETKSSNERIIPIHIEGRDEPVLPKNVSSSSYSSQQHAAPQPDRLFGKPTEHFTQFLPHDRDTRFGSNWNQGFPPEEHIRQQRFQPQFSSQKKPQPFVPPQTKGEIPIPVQRDVPPKQQEQHQPHHQQPQPQQQYQQEQKRSTSPEQPKVQPQHKPLGPLEQIQVIQKDVSSLMEQVEAFSGKSKDKQYLYLDEMLTRNLIKLDNIDTQGQETIRSARKEAIKCIEKTIGILEAKASATTDVPKESSGKPKENSTFPDESTDVPKEISDVPREMEVDEQKQEVVDMKENPSTKQQKIEPMETEVVSNKALEVQEEIRANQSSCGDGQDNMEVSEVSIGTEVNTEKANKNEDMQKTKDVASDSKPDEKEHTSESKLPEEKQEASTEDKEKTIIEVEMKEESNPVPDSNVIVENATEQAANIQDKVTEKTPSTENTTKSNEEKIEGGDSDDQKEKKDKKKGKKKIEKKEK